MKVLWFTNTPCSAVEILGMNLNSGGWLRSLEEEINKVPNIELAICFYSYEKIKPFNYKATRFYPVYRHNKSTKLKRFINRLSSRNDDEKDIRELLKVVEDYLPDIIHVHGTEDNFGLVQYHTNIPVVISIQGILNAISEKYFTGVPMQIIARYESILNKLAAGGIRHEYEQFLQNAEREKRILEGAKYIIGRTDFDRRITRVLAPSSAYFEGNEILRQSFYKTVWNKTQFADSLRIITIINSARYKGFEAIVDTARTLKNNTNLKFVWNVIGLNEKSSLVKIVKKWKNVNLQELGIQILGSMNESEIVDVLLQSDIYCQTSHIENSPNSLCEAMMLGMPIVATAVGGTCSLFDDKEGAILVQDNAPLDMCSAIIELLHSLEFKNDCRQSTRKQALERHSPRDIISKLLATYKEVI